MTTVLRGITWDHPRGLDSVRGAAAAYADAEDVRVEWDVRSLQGFADQPLPDLALEYDLLVIDHPHIPEAHHLGVLLPLDAQGRDDQIADLAADSVGPSHSTYEHEGHLYGLAIDAAAQVSVHRPDLLPTPPRTWDEVFELARSGRVLWAAKPVDAISTFLTLMAGRGTPVGADGRFADLDAGLEVLQTMQSLAALVPEPCLSANPIEIAEMLSSRDEWSYAPLSFGYVNYSRPGFRQHRLAHVDMPLARDGTLRGSCLGGAGVAVSARSVHAAAAVAHAFWLARPDVQRGVYFASGGQPGSATAWDDDAVNADSRDFFRNTRATLEGSWVRPRYDGWLDVQDLAGNLVNQVLRRDLDPARCLARAEDVYQRSLEPGRETRGRA